MDTASIFATLVSGSVIGLILGLVGGGGSILAVPLLIYIVGIGSTHAAIGTAAVAVTANALASLIGHARAGRVKWRCAGGCCQFNANRSPHDAVRPLSAAA